MRKHKYTYISLLCRILLVLAFICLGSPARALTAPQMGAALKELGLFNGTSYGLELDKPCDRLMGAVILTRLLGREQEALTRAYSHPFADVTGTYAEPYVAYLYQQGLINGVTATSFGAFALTGQQFTALILRSLGYVDGVDFNWENTLSFAVQAGMLSSTEEASLNNGGFLRAQAVLLCYRALLTTPKGEDRPLIHRLLWQDAFTTRQLAKSQDAQLILAADMPDPLTFQVHINSEQEFTDIIWLALKNRQSNLVVQAPDISPDRAQTLIDRLMAPYFSRDFMIEFTPGNNNTFYFFFYIGEYMSMQFYFQDPERYEKNHQFYDEQYQQELDGYISMYMWRQKIAGLVNNIMPEGADEYGRVKAAHDYLVAHTRYDDYADEQSTSHFAEGVLFENKGVCDGFASAFKMLLDGAGVECRVIYGDTPDRRHAWNQVNIDGQWYNVDITWAKTIGGEKSIYYGYFCAPDSIFLRDHTPEKPGIAQPCTSTLYYQRQIF